MRYVNSEFFSAAYIVSATALAYARMPRMSRSVALALDAKRGIFTNATYAVLELANKVKQLECM